jgi:hypothetical protein
LKKSSDNRTLVLKAFLSRFPAEKSRALERFLPEAERLFLEKLPAFTEEIRAETFANSSLVEKVHWSWFLPTLETYSDTEQKLFLSSVSSQAAKNLAKALKISLPTSGITEASRSFLRQILIQSLTGPEDRLLPAAYLPPSALSPLLHSSKRELIRLIDSLAIYDLAAELRQIVETKILKKIYSFLSEGEKKFLKIASAHKEHFVLNRMGLSAWDGTEESLRTLLHKRGLARLGAALSGQHPDLVWILCHQLDIGRGNALFKLCAKEPIPGVSEAIIRQITELL